MGDVSNNKRRFKKPPVLRDFGCGKVVKHHIVSIACQYLQILMVFIADNTVILQLVIMYFTGVFF